MDLKQLEYFLRVVEMGSFTRAALALDVAQPALSRQVRLLEVELRQNLLRRHGRGVTPTQAGKVLAEHCRGILHQVERAREDMSRVHGALAGRIVLGMPPSASKMITVELTRQFRRQLPDATLSIVEGMTLTMQEWLMAGRLDIALLYNPNITAELNLSPIVAEPLYVVSTRGPHPIAEPICLQAVSKLPLVIPNQPHTVRTLLETEMAQIGCKPKISLEMDSIPAILDLVADGAGYAVLTSPAVLTTVRPERYHMRLITQPKLYSRLYLATTAGRITNLTQRAMIELIQQTARQVYPD